MNRPDDFWSRRRAGVEAETRSEARRTEKAEADACAAELDGMSDEEALRTLGLPDPDTVVSGGDVRAFLARSVPAHLRRRALRSLWVSNPVLANLDGLVDYADDYTDAATVVPNLRTSYRVGKGLLRHVEALAAAAEDAAGAEPAAIRPAPGTDEPGDTADTQPDPATEAEVPARQEEETDALPRPRRMAFRFEEATS